MRSSQLFEILSPVPLLTLVAFVTLAASAPGGRDPKRLTAPSVYFHPNVLDFTVEETSTQNTTLTNNSSSPLEIKGFALQGSKPICTVANDCGETLGAHTSCAVSVSCSPAEEGRIGDLIETDDSPIGHHEVLLEATGS